MNIKYAICCGTDVHKSFLIAVIVKNSQPKPQYIKKRFSTFNKDLLEFKKWLIGNECFYLCMESTGKYWIPIYNVLEDNINITLANPKWVRTIKGEKDDNKDAKWIADLFRLGLVRGSYIPSKEIRILREFTRYKYKLTCTRTSEMNRYHNCLTVGNLAIIVISEIGCDMNQFSSHQQLCSWAGLTPTNNQSAGKKKSVKISHAGVYLKPCLVQVAHAAIKDKTNVYYAKKYERISKRRGKKRAIIAIARMILVAIYHMIKTGEIWNPSDLKDIEMPVDIQVKLAKSNLNHVIKILISNGLSIKEIAKQFSHS